MASTEQYTCFDHSRAIEMWDIASDSDDPEIAAIAWFNLGLMQRISDPIVAAHAFERAMLVGDRETSGDAAAELAKLAERLGDNIIMASAAQCLLELADGDERARAALLLGRINQCDHPDDAEDAYHAAIAEPGASPDTIGAALAWLGTPRIAEAFAAERAAIGRVTRLRKRPLG